MGRRLFFILMLLFFFLNISAQKYLIRNYSEKDGLPSSLINDINQDKYGRIWFAGRAGVSIYNGLEYTDVTLKEGLPDLVCAKLRRDDETNMWALFESVYLNVLYYDYSEWHRLPAIEEPILQDAFTGFEVLGSGLDAKVFVGTLFHGVFIYDEGVWTQHKDETGLLSGNITGISKADEGVFISSNKGLIFYDHHGKRFKQLNYDLPSNDLKGLYYENGILWIAGNNWIGKIENDAFEFLVSYQELDISNYIVIHPDKHQGVYWGNKEFISYYSFINQKTQNFGLDNGFMGLGANSFFIDREDCCWIATSRGVSKIVSRVFANYDKTSGLFENEVTAIEQRIPGEIILGHYNGLSIMKDGEIQTIKFLDRELFGNNQVRVSDLYTDKQGKVWIACSFIGLGVLDHNNKVTWLDESAGLEFDVSSVIENEKLGFFASDRIDVLKRKGQHFESILPEHLGNFYTRKMFSFGDKLYLATSTKGLMVYDGKSFKVYDHAGDEKVSNIFSVWIDEKDSIVGTMSGLYEIKNGELKRFLKDEFPVDRPVYLMLKDQNGDFWFGTDYGMFKWDGKKIRNYNIATGFIGQETNRSAGYMNDQGRIFIGSDNGLSIYQREYEYDYEDLPEPMIFPFNVNVGPEVFNMDDEINLKYSQNDLSFNFQVITFLNEEQVVYKARLVGLEEKWSEQHLLPRGTLNYYNLDPGTYTFELQIKNMFGEWSDIYRSENINIKTPYYQKLWFIILLVLISALIILIIMRTILRQSYTKRLKEEVDLRTMQLNELNATKDKFFSIIAHDLKAPFSSILGFSDLLYKNNDKYSNEQKLSFIQNIKNSAETTYNLLINLLDWARAQSDKISYQFEYQNLFLLVDETIDILKSHSQKKGIQLKTDISPSAKIFADKNSVLTVIRNLVSNAIKFSEPGSEVLIKAEETRDKVLLHVIDHGMGIRPKDLEKLFKIGEKFETIGTANEKGTGLGLIISKEFIQANHGEISVQSKPGEGSVFTITLSKFSF